MGRIRERVKDTFVQLTHVVFINIDQIPCILFFFYFSFPIFFYFYSNLFYYYTCSKNFLILNKVTILSLKNKIKKKLQC